jgi:hypothetical protein
VNSSLGIAVATAGFPIMAVGVVGANVVFFRSLPLMLNRQLMRAARNEALTFVFWLVAWAAVAMLGITVMLLGLVLAGNVVTWAPILPFALVVLMIPLAWYLRWQAEDGEIRRAVGRDHPDLCQWLEDEDERLSGKT